MTQLAEPPLVALGAAGSSGRRGPLIVLAGAAAMLTATQSAAFTLDPANPGLFVRPFSGGVRLAGLRRGGGPHRRRGEALSLRRRLLRRAVLRLRRRHGGCPGTSRTAPCCRPPRSGRSARPPSRPTNPAARGPAAPPRARDPQPWGRGVVSRARPALRAVRPGAEPRRRDLLTVSRQPGTPPRAGASLRRAARAAHGRDRAPALRSRRCSSHPRGRAGRPLRHRRPRSRWRGPAPGRHRPSTLPRRRLRRGDLLRTSSSTSRTTRRDAPSCVA